MHCWILAAVLSEDPLENPCLNFPNLLNKNATKGNAALKLLHENLLIRLYSHLSIIKDGWKIHLAEGNGLGWELNNWLWHMIEWKSFEMIAGTYLAGDFFEPSTRVQGIAGVQFEMKLKPPCQAQEWSYSYHQEPVGKAFSSVGFRSNKKTHFSRGSSALMADIMGVNEDQI
ncbi:hypothetical protein [Absidia glauca]|uniref:Ndc10 domain-containing protein n=1 Tax=Absidia glauca TaxID=4829 RepID=A0A163KBQ6_ABSGL|nr:hypothetical protein [Absidia glauca]